MQVFLHAVGDAQQDGGAFGGGCAAPVVLDGMRGVEGLLHVFGRGFGEFAEGLGVDRAMAGEVPAMDRRCPAAADVVAVPGVNSGFMQAVHGMLDSGFFGEIDYCHG